MVFGPLQRDCARKTVGQRVGWGCRLEGEDALGVGGRGGRSNLEVPRAE